MYIRKFFILVVMAVMVSANAVAQSSMTDDQVIRFVMRESASGSSQAQIVTKLMQRGVKIDQIRRLRDKYASMSKGKGADALGGSGSGADASRMRVNNAADASGDDGMAASGY